MGFYVYILRCADGSYYAGHTGNLPQRVAQHERGEVPGYTHKRRPVELVFADEFPARIDARERERQIKGWSRARKEALIRGNWSRLRRLTKAFSGEQHVVRKSAQPSAAPASGGLRSGFAGAEGTLRLRPGRTDVRAAGSGRTGESGGPVHGMQAGKLPNELLARLLGKVKSRDPRVVFGPGVGRDAAVIDAGGPKLLVAKSDPITFATDLIGRYAVTVNANDIACMGARPAWFMATVLLPEGCAPDLPETVFNQIVETCGSLDIELVGGHTEVTYGLARPLVIGALLGEVERDRLVRPDGARPGDALILTRGVAVEGTGVLAREAGERLVELGMQPRDVEAAKGYILDPGISVERAASAAAGAVRVHAMHDPTEGGLATALYEMAEAAGVGVAVQREAIEVLPLTRILCRKAGLDPLGLLASGSLLLAVAQEDCGQALAAIEAAGVPARRIGALAGPEQEVIMEGATRSRAVPRFARDEAARFLTKRAGQPG